VNAVWAVEARVLRVMVVRHEIPRAFVEGLEQ